MSPPKMDLQEVRQAESIRWKRQVEEPANRFLYYPIAHRLVRLLVKTPVTANQVTLVQPLIAAVAGYLISFGDWRYMVLGALTFELRSLLDCVDGSLARAKNASSPNGHALDALADWLGVVFLYGGIYAHFLFHPPPAGAWSAYLPMGAVIGVALFQGAMRSFAHDYFMRKFGSIFETGRDETVEDLRDKQRALSPDSPFMAKAEAWIGRCQHLSFQFEFFDVERSKSISGEQARVFAAQRSTPGMKLIQWLWSISNGDAFIRITVITVALGHAFLWQLLLFWAGIGTLWIVAAMLLTSWFVKRATERVSEPLQV
jgi:phosphatidylglycerophosphate synthase